MNDKTEKEGRKAIQFTLRVSEELWLLIEQVMKKGGHRSINEFVRTCIRAYVDETEDIVGSRRHFSKSMAERMDRLEAMLLWNSLQAQVMTARGMFTVLDELAPEDAPQEPPTPDVRLFTAAPSPQMPLPPPIDRDLGWELDRL